MMGSFGFDILAFWIVKNFSKTKWALFSWNGKRSGEQLPNESWNAFKSVSGEAIQLAGGFDGGAGSRNTGPGKFCLCGWMDGGLEAETEPGNGPWCGTAMVGLIDDFWFLIWREGEEWRIWTTMGAQRTWMYWLDSNPSSNFTTSTDTRKAGFWFQRIGLIRENPRNPWLEPLWRVGSNCGYRWFRFHFLLMILPSMILPLSPPIPTEQDPSLSPTPTRYPAAHSKPRSWIPNNSIGQNH